MRYLAALFALLTGCVASPPGVPAVLERGTGDVVVQATVHAVFVGAWAPGPMQTLTGNWTALLNSPGGVLDRLQEYGVTWGDFSTLTPVNIRPDLKGTLSELELVTVLDTAMDAGTISPAGPSDIYLVLLGTGLATNVFSLVADEQGYHSAHPYKGAFYAYGVVADVSSVDRANIIASHELYEAATDPWGGSWRQFARPYNELGDLCEGQLTTIAGVTVQKVWSVKAGACI